MKDLQVMLLHIGPGNFKQEYGEMLNPGLADQLMGCTQDVDRKKSLLNSADK